MKRYIPTYKLIADIALREDLALTPDGGNALTKEAIQILLSERLANLRIAGFRVEKMIIE